MYLFNLYDTSIIELLRNNVTRICREIAKISVIFWESHTCNVNGPEDGEKMGRTRMYFLSFAKIIRDEQL